MKNINPNITRIVHYNEPKRNITVTYTILNYSETGYQIKFAASIYNKNNQPWIKKNHIVTAINRLIVRPNVVDINDDCIDNLKPLLRRLVLKHGVSGKRISETKLAKRTRICQLDLEFNVLKQQESFSPRDSISIQKNRISLNSSEINYNGDNDGDGNIKKSISFFDLKSMTKNTNDTLVSEKRKGFIGESCQDSKKGKRVSDVKKIINFFNTKGKEIAVY